MVTGSAIQSLQAKQLQLEWLQQKKVIEKKN